MLCTNKGSTVIVDRETASLSAKGSRPTSAPDCRSSSRAIVGGGLI
jgi:hypothetical protein